MGFYRWGIGLYQKHLSPRKGYRCAHSLEHGGPGCSGAILEILEAKGFIRGFGLIRDRFASCEESAAQRKKRKQQEKKNPSGGGQDDSCLKGCTFELFDCSPPKLPDCGSCDVPSCDAPSCNHYTIRLWKRK